MEVVGFLHYELVVGGKFWILLLTSSCCKVLTVLIYSSRLLVTWLKTGDECYLLAPGS